MEMQQQDWFIFSKSIDLYTDRNEAVGITNQAYIKFCLGVGLKQKQLHSLDIRKYLPNTTHMSRGRRTRQNRGSSGSIGGRQKAEKKQVKQMDIRDMIEDRRSKYKEERQKNKSRSKQMEISRDRIVTDKVVEDTTIQTVIKDYFQAKEKAPRENYRSMSKSQTK
eukprot:9632522-Ditylum_brightwellii.AAC.1